MNRRRTDSGFRRTLAPFALAVLATSLAGCGIFSDIASSIDPSMRLPSIDGPEDDHLLDDVHGTLVWSDLDHHAEAISMPSLDRSRFQVDSALVSGPAASGLFLYRRRNTSKQDLRWRDLSTGSEGIVVAKVPPMNCFSMELCASGMRAFVSWGDLDIIDSGRARTWSHGQGTVREFEDLLVRRASWLPDGRHIVIESWITASAGQGVPPLEVGEGWDQEARTRNGLPKLWPSLQVLDTDTGNCAWITWGRDPLVSPDGERLLFARAPREPLRLREMNSGMERAVELPGLLRQRHWHEGESDDSRVDGVVYQWLSNHIVIYDALPTADQNPGYVSKLDLQTNHPKWTVKAADVDTLAFKTVIESANETACSFGPGVLPASNAVRSSEDAD